MEPVFFGKAPRTFNGLKTNVLHAVLAHIDLHHDKQSEVEQDGWYTSHQQHIEVRNLQEISNQKRSGAQHGWGNNCAQAPSSE